MKKIFCVLASIALMLGACSSVPKVTLADAISVFEDEGIEIDTEKKPLFQMISASDGVIFYIDNKPVKIYEYASDADYKKGLEALPQMSDWPKIGNIVLETSNEQAIDIFNSLPK